MRIFLSYQHADTLYPAHAVFRALKADGHEVFLDDADLAPGDRFWGVIREQIAETEVHWQTKRISKTD